MKTRRVLLIADVENWAYDIIAKSIKDKFRKYECDIVYFKDMIRGNTKVDANNYDVIMAFFWYDMFVRGNLIENLDIRKVCVTVQSHNSWLKRGITTEDTVRHLLDVSSGLESSVLGDSEIIHQIKKSYQFSMTHKLQGSLLERAIQSVFKSHKRISNETNFRDGTTSVAYKALKVVQNNFKNTTSSTKKILCIGAGDIVKQLFKYNSKFNFNNIYISNRSEDKAVILAQNNKCKTFPWQNVLTNNFDEFEVIISAVSNCANLIHDLPVSNHNVLLLDLAVPCNIDKSLAYQNNVIFHDLDSISKELEENRELRIASKSDVLNIIIEELTSYNAWLKEAPLRALLANLKISINKVVTKQFQPNAEYTQIKLVTNEVMKKLIYQKETLALLPENELNNIISKEASLIINNF